MIYLSQFALPKALEGPCTSSECRLPLIQGHLVRSTPVGIYHTPCTPATLLPSAGCPDCGERHPQPYDGTCLL